MDSIVRAMREQFYTDMNRRLELPQTDYSRQSTERAKKNDVVRFGMCNVSIRKVIFNDPATIVLWSDGSKTVVKCGPEDT